jgi:hypothetical protein
MVFAMSGGGSIYKSSQEIIKPKTIALGFDFLDVDENLALVSAGLGYEKAANSSPKFASNTLVVDIGNAGTVCKFLKVL